MTDKEDNCGLAVEDYFVTWNRLRLESAAVEDIKEASGLICKHEKSKREGWYNLHCIDMRTNEDLCGKEKRLYKPKETTK